MKEKTLSQKIGISNKRLEEIKKRLVEISVRYKYKSEVLKEIYKDDFFKEIEKIYAAAAVGGSWAMNSILRINIKEFLE